MDFFSNDNAILNKMQIKFNFQLILKKVVYLQVSKE